LTECAVYDVSKNVSERKVLVLLSPPSQNGRSRLGLGKFVKVLPRFRMEQIFKCLDLERKDLVCIPGCK